MDLGFLLMLIPTKSLQKHIVNTAGCAVSGER